MPALPILAVLFACAHAPSSPAGSDAAPLSYPQRAAAALGLREHRSPPAPDWLREGRGFWTRTTTGACVLFQGSAEYATHRLCSVDEDGWTVSTYTSLSLAIDPPPFPPATELPLVAGGYRRKPPPIYGDARGEGGTELVVGSSLATTRTRPCDRASTRALAGEDPGELWHDHAVRAGLKHCPTERGGKALTERLETSGTIRDYWPETLHSRGPVDSREPCAPYQGTWEPDPIYIPPGGIPNPLYRDPKPESFLLFRTEADCLASPEPGVLRLPEGECDDPWLHPAEVGPPVIRSAP